MQLIALTGGIASGKSVVARRFGELGAVHIDADALAREVVAPGSDGLAAIAQAFGRDILLPDGQLDRPALGRLIFSDADQRGVLNAITHPRVRALAMQRIADAAASDPDAIVIYDVPLLAEAKGGSHSFDRVVVVHADVEERIRRMIEDRGMTREEALGRIEAQATDAERLAIADIVIENNSTVDDLIRQVDEVWQDISHT